MTVTHRNLTTAPSRRERIISAFHVKCAVVTDVLLQKFIAATNQYVGTAVLYMEDKEDCRAMGWKNTTGLVCRHISHKCLRKRDFQNSCQSVLLLNKSEGEMSMHLPSATTTGFVWKSWWSSFTVNMLFNKYGDLLWGAVRAGDIRFFFLRKKPLLSETSEVKREYHYTLPPSLNPLHNSL